MNAPGRWLLPLALAALSIYFLVLVHGILLPFILAATLAYLLKPAVDFFVVHGLRRSTVVIAIYGAMLCIFTGGVYFSASLFSQEASKAALKMPEYVQKGQAFVERLQHTEPPSAASLGDRSLMAIASDHANIITPLLSRAKSWPSTILQHMPTLASHLLPMLELSFLVPFLAFFIMMEGPAFINQIFEWIPARYVEMSLNMLIEIDSSLGNYVRGLSLEALAVGLTAFAGFGLIGLDYALQISILVGLANLIPYVGPIVGALLGCSVALFEWGTPVGIFKVLIVCAAVRLIEDWFWQPMIMKRAVHLHPVLIVFSLMAGTTLWGFWGLLFGVPVACMVKVLFQVLSAWYRSEYGDRYDPTPSEVSHIPII
jgi:predicted PurR-regulated permease PerM